MRGGNTNANADCYGDRDTYGNSNYDAYTECNSDSHTNSYSTIRNAYANTTKSNTEASANPASSAVREAVIGEK